jgi:addiction module HigA family antidote
MKSPGEQVREELEKRGWTQSDLARIIERPLPSVNEIIGGKRAIMPEMAIALGVAFGNGAEYWTKLEADYKAIACLRSPHAISTSVVFSGSSVSPGRPCREV